MLTYGCAICGAAFGPQIILVPLWKRASYAGCLAGMLIGFVVALIWPQADDANIPTVEVYSLPLGFATALLTHIVVSLRVASRVEPTGFPGAPANTGSSGKNGMR